MSDQPQRTLPSREDVRDVVAAHRYRPNVGLRADDPGWHPCDCGEWEGYWCDFDTHATDAVLALFAAQPTVAQVKAEALREAADRMPAFHDGDVPEWAVESACKWLNERAYRIESEADHA